MCKAPNDVMYQDGGIRANCPAQVAFRERQYIWPNLDAMDCLVSIGTGFTIKEDIPVSARFYWRLSKALFSRALDAQAQWEDAIVEFERQYPGKILRHNPELVKKIPLDDVSKIEELERVTNSYYSRRYTIQELRATAMTLISSLFYFEVHKIEKNPSHWVSVSGQISCRLHYLEEDARKRLQAKIRDNRGVFLEKTGSNTVRGLECSEAEDLTWIVTFTAENDDQELSLELYFSKEEKEEKALISGMPQRVKVCDQWHSEQYIRK